jgi:hypothetical protein
MKTVILWIFATPLIAQQPPAPAATAPATTAPATASPVPASENMVTGWVEAGYRWNTGVGGSQDTYRSVVNLGSGLKLIGADFVVLNPGHRYFDRIHVQASDWQDPYSMLRVDVEKQAVYRLSVSVRSLAYFNNLPSYADPLLARGIALDEQSFDTRRHLASVDLQLLPNHRVSPYLAVDSDSDNGHGVSTFVTGGNDYAVPYNTNDRTRLYRGGVHIKLPRMQMTLEEGYTSYRNDQNTYWNGLNTGNSSTPVLGQTLDLTGLARAYGVRGSGTYTKATLSADPLSWLDVHATFGFAQPHNSAQYTQFDTGSLVLLSQVLFYGGESFIQSAEAKMPHTTAEGGWEIRVNPRLRIQQVLLTDRMHDSGSSGVLNASLANNYSHAETEVFYDAGAHLTLRVGYRHVWANAGDLVLPASGLPTIEKSALSRNVGLASVTWKPIQRLSVTGDLESASSHGEYFRTSLHNYRKIRLAAHYDLMHSLRADVNYTVLTNQNPLAGSPYRAFFHDESLTLTWIPPAKKLTFDATYEHCGNQTEITYIDPTYLISSTSIYREYCHTVTALANATLPKLIRISAGGSAVLTSGSRPNTWYQPVAKVSMPIARGLGWFAEWKYYDFGESFYLYENFRTHLFTTGLRFSR